MLLVLDVLVPSPYYDSTLLLQDSIDVYLHGRTLK